jgi:ABC-type phosphate transport system substrate-binding protein
MTMLMLARAVGLLAVTMALNGTALAAGWGNDTTVKSLLPQGSSSGTQYYIELAASQNPDSCSTPLASVVVIDGSTQLGKYLIAAVMQAKATNSTVNAYYNGCESGTGYAKITGVWVK